MNTKCSDHAYDEKEKRKGPSTRRGEEARRFKINSCEIRTGNLLGADYHRLFSEISRTILEFAVAAGGHTKREREL